MLEAIMIPFSRFSGWWRGLSSLCLFWFITGARAQVAFQVGTNFTGSTYGVNSAALPPDPNGCIGPKHFVEFINGAFNVYNRTNGRSVLRKTDTKFWSDAGVIIASGWAVSDPRVIYDPISRRWFASQVDFDAGALSGDPTLEANDFLLAVSDTSDPTGTGTWHGYIFQADPDFGDFADFPTLGVDSNAVYLSGDFFVGSDNPVGPGLVSIPKADLLAGTPTIATRTWSGVMDYGVRGQVLQPAICLDGSSSGNILAVGDIGNTSDPHSNLVSFVVQNPAAPNATLTASTSITVEPYVVPFNADVGAPMFNPLQPDGTTRLAANDARLSARVFAAGGVLYATHSTEVNNRIAIRWYRLDAATHVLLESGTIADTNLDLFFPSIAANKNGTVIIGCNGCSRDTFVSCYALAGQTLNGVTTFGKRILLQAGVVSYHGDDELYDELLGLPPISRWGDYSTVTVDPNDSSQFWFIGMFPSDAANNNVWSTRITQLLTASLQLAISRAGANVMVSWPGLASDFQLLSATNLAPPVAWSKVTQIPATNGNTISALVPIVGRQQFFRLYHP
jgi:hypothetical protein